MGFRLLTDHRESMQFPRSLQQRILQMHERTEVSLVRTQRKQLKIICWSVRHRPSEATSKNVQHMKMPFMLK